MPEVVVDDEGNERPFSIFDFANSEVLKEVFTNEEGKPGEYDLAIPKQVNTAVDHYLKYERTAGSERGMHKRVNNINEVVSLINEAHEVKKKWWRNKNGALDDIYKKIGKKGIRNSLYSPTMEIGTTDDPIQSLYVVDDYKNYTDARVIHRGLDLMDSVISDPVREAIKKPYTINVEGADDMDNAYIQKRFKELAVYEKIEDLAVKCRLSSLGAVLLPVFENEDDIQEKSVNDMENTSLLPRLASISVVPDYAFWYIGHSALGSVWKPDYGRPHVYYVGGKRVSVSRIFHAVNQYDPLLQRGVSVLGQNVLAVKGLNIAELTMVHSMLQSQLRIFKYPSELERLGQTNESLTKKYLEVVGKVKRQATNRSFIVLPDNFDISLVDFAVSPGIREATDYLYDFLAGTTRKGSALWNGRGLGEVSSGDRVLQQYRDHIKSNIQMPVVVKALEFLLQFILREEPIADKQLFKRHIEINPTPIYEESEREQLENALLREDLYAKQLENRDYESAGDLPTGGSANENKSAGVTGHDEEMSL